MNNYPDNIRFQATGEKHRVVEFVDISEKEFWWLTKCGLRCMFGTVGKMKKEPPKTNCGECYG